MTRDETHREPREDRDAALYSPPRHYTRDHDPRETGPEDAPRVRGPEPEEPGDDPPDARDGGHAGPSR